MFALTILDTGCVDQPLYKGFALQAWTSFIMRMKKIGEVKWMSENTEVSSLPFYTF